MAQPPNIDAFVRHGGAGQPIELVRVRDGAVDVCAVTEDQAELMAIGLLQAARSNRQAREPGSRGGA